MSASLTQGHIHSIQTLGTLDGPGVRFVVFTQGCPLRCGCCHNPDTWERDGGMLMSAEELAERAERYRPYFGDKGGVTLSGGEPLLQGAFAKAFFEACHKRGLHTCLDTSGCILNGETEALLHETDRVLLDIKYPTDGLYRQYVGCGIETPLRFLSCLNEQGIPTTLRQVIIPTLNDTEESMSFLAELKENHPCVDEIELLPFKKLCTVKYEQLGLDFRFAFYPEPTSESMKTLEEQIK